jgi:hypothetical protein
LQAFQDEGDLVVLSNVLLGGFGVTLSHHGLLMFLVCNGTKSREVRLIGLNGPFDDRCLITAC